MVEFSTASSSNLVQDAIGGTIASSDEGVSILALLGNGQTS